MFDIHSFLGKKMESKSRICEYEPCGSHRIASHLHTWNPIKCVGVHVCVLDDLTKHIQNEVPWCMSLANDIVLLNETRVEINYKSEL